MTLAVRKLHYFSVGSTEDSKFFEASIRELNDWLHQKFDVRFELHYVSPSDQDEILEVLRSSNAHHWAAQLKKIYVDKFDKTTAPVLAVYCPDDFAISTNAREAVPAAAWGVSDQSTFAVTYEANNRQLLWHELLHTIGADDCYVIVDGVPIRMPECDCSQCLMWYIPNETNCGASPQLCSPNIQLVSDYVKRVQQP